MEIRYHEQMSEWWLKRYGRLREVVALERKSLKGGGRLREMISSERYSIREVVAKERWSHKRGGRTRDMREVVT